MSNASESSGVKRRDFLKILGVSGAAIAAAGCDQHKDKIVTYLNSPDQTVPGVSTYYATTCRECQAACGIIAETRDGRTTKLEGNPDHPLNRGALCARGQAALQGLYNPDRYRGPMIRKGTGMVETSWDQALSLFAQQLGTVRSKGGAGNAVFLMKPESGSFPGFLDTWLAGYGMPPHMAWDSTADAAVEQANQQSYGVAWPGFDFMKAKLIVSIGADFLDGWGAMVPNQLAFADARASVDNAPRFVYIGPRRSLTGLNADEWIPCTPGSELAIVQALAGQGSVDQAASASGAPADRLAALARELKAAGPSLVLSGVSTPNALDVATAVNALNKALGNVGTTIRPDQAITSLGGSATFADMAALVDRMKAGQVTMLMIRGANPVHSLPKSLGFAEALQKVPFKVSFSSYPDETSELCDLVLPDDHALEQWGDAQPMRNVVSLQQPAMPRVFQTMATPDVLIAVAKKDPANAARYPEPSYQDWLISRFPGGMNAFAAALTRGVVTGMTLPAAGPARPSRAAAPARTIAPQSGSGDFWLVVYPSSVLGDGEGANKPWLQELPDPVTKICWQTWVELHPLTARKLGIDRGDIVEVKTAEGTLRGPCYQYLGVRQDVVAVALGQGHTAYGRYAKGTGANAYALVSPATGRGGGLPLTGMKASIRKTGDHAELVTTEGSARQHGRGVGQALLLVDGQLREDPRGTERLPGHEAGKTVVAEEGVPPAEAKGTGLATTPHEELPGDASHAFLPGLRSPVAADAQGDFARQASKEKGLYSPNDPRQMGRRRWAMTIDLARCTGCSACVTACYAENNIPTVGAPWQAGNYLAEHSPGINIVHNREMNWIRIERYWEGGEDGSANFDTRVVPMLCQHCGNAPCEPVCPVYATYHSPDGLNVQVYNRCVGTRYCSNNCPYKVRYFNWFGYGNPDQEQYAFPSPLDWQLNPDVTVRDKGVMEKCTFCVQRIREAENRARLEGREVKPDEFTVACAQACPSRAIVFGDAANPEWSVARMAQDRRAYHVFEELNTFTAVVYLKKVNHPAPAAPAQA